MSKVRSIPCTACPYRRDVPSGVWAAEEYDKLPPYDRPTGEQPVAGFSCHVTPDHYCHGWALVHTNRGHDFDLLSLRFAAFKGEDVDLPDNVVPLFGSGTEAAEHGRRDIAKPSAEALATMLRLHDKHDRLEWG